MDKQHYTIEEIITENVIPFLQAYIDKIGANIDGESAEILLRFDKVNRNEVIFNGRKYSSFIDNSNSIDLAFDKNSFLECFECGSPAAEWHHIIPRNLGGTKTIPLCPSCHTRVHNMSGERRDAHNKNTLRGLAAAKRRGVKLGGANPNYGKNSVLTTEQRQKYRGIISNITRLINGINSPTTQIFLRAMNNRLPDFVVGSSIGASKLADVANDLEVYGRDIFPNGITPQDVYQMNYRYGQSIKKLQKYYSQIPQAIKELEDIINDERSKVSNEQLIDRIKGAEFSLLQLKSFKLL